MNSSYPLLQHQLNIEKIQDEFGDELILDCFRVYSPEMYGEKAKLSDLLYLVVYDEGEDLTDEEYEYLAKSLRCLQPVQSEESDDGTVEVTELPELSDDEDDEEEFGTLTELPVFPKCVIQPQFARSMELFISVKRELPQLAHTWHCVEERGVPLHTAQRVRAMVVCV